MHDVLKGHRKAHAHLMGPAPFARNCHRHGQAVLYEKQRPHSRLILKTHIDLTKAYCKASILPVVQ